MSTETMPFISLTCSWFCVYVEKLISDENIYHPEHTIPHSSSYLGNNNKKTECCRHDAGFVVIQTFSDLAEVRRNQLGLLDVKTFQDNQCTLAYRFAA